MSTNSIGISNFSLARSEQQRHGAYAQGGESAVAAVDFAQLLRARHGEMGDGVSESSSVSRARKSVSDDPASAASTSPAAAANIAAAALVAGVPAVALMAKATSHVALGSASVPGAAAASIAGARPAAPMRQGLTPPERFVSRESGKSAVDVAPAEHAPKRAPRSATSTSVTVIAAAPARASAAELAVGQQMPALAVPAAPPHDATRIFQPPTSFTGTEKLAATKPGSDPAEAKPDRFAPLPLPSATLGMPGGVSPASVVDAHPGVVQALASEAAEAASRLAGAASASLGPQKLQIDIDNGDAGRIHMDMVFSEPGHAALVVHASSEAQSQLLDDRSQQLVDNLRELGLEVQVSVRQGSTQGGASDGRSNSSHGMAGVAPAHAVRQSADPMTPVSAMAPRDTGGTRLDLYA